MILKLDELQVQMRRYKYSETGIVTRTALRIPTTEAEDPLRKLFVLLLAHAEEDLGYLFTEKRAGKPAAASVMGRALSKLLNDSVARALTVMKFTPPSLRSAAMSGAFACGVPLPVIS